VTTKLRPGKHAAISDDKVLAAILARTRTVTRGAKVEELLPVFATTRANAFKRIGRMLRDGLITRVPGSRGEYILTPAGLVQHSRRQGDPR
jgi:hypothetical protein